MANGLVPSLPKSQETWHNKTLPIKSTTCGITHEAVTNCPNPRPKIFLSSFNQGNWLMRANLDPVVPGVGHDDLVLGVGVDIPGVGELTGLVTL